MTGLVGLHLIAHQEIELVIVDRKQHGIFQVIRQALQLLHIGCFVDATGFKIKEIGLGGPKTDGAVNLVNEGLGKADIMNDVPK